jgi:hypothetical protein
MSICKNCDFPAVYKFCPQCGQKSSTERFTAKHLLHSFLHGFFHIDHGIIYTVKELLINPGKMLRDYLYGKRIAYFNPFTFILIVSGLLTIFLPKLIQQSLFMEFGWVDPKNVNTNLMQSSLKHISIRAVLGLPLFALVSYTFYRKKEYNIYENLIANTYMRGQCEIFMLLLFPLLIGNHSQTMSIIFSVVYLLITILYHAWAYCGMFENKITFTGIIKGFTCALTANIIEITIANLLLIKELPS